MKIYKIDTEYINYLRKIDKRVMMPKEEEHVRPYVGVVLEINNNLFFAPLTSINKSKKLDIARGLREGKHIMVL